MGDDTSQAANDSSWPDQTAVDTNQKDQRLPVKLIVVFTILLAAVTVGIYWQTHRFQYVTFDDGAYVYDNPHVNQGLSLSAVAWAFTALYINWHPLTWVSLMLDVQVFGLNAGSEHLVNVAIHIASAALLFVAMAMMTRRTLRSALIASLFAVHPLHVESVAWIAERKDVLSTFFELLALLLYFRYTARPGWSRYTAVTLAFAASLMAKPMAITFPFILLLLDYWPLQRLNSLSSIPELMRPIREKALLFAMSIATCVLTILAQKSSGAMIPLARISMSDRVANAIVALARYLEITFWPSHLAVFYPIEPRQWSAVFCSAAILLLITAIAVFKSRTHRYLLVGWLWYLIMLLPVIGIVQVGLQSMADRYMYMPMVGISIAVVWSLGDSAPAKFQARAALFLSGVFVVLILAVAAHRQVSFWADSETLYNRALTVTRDNYLAENNLGAVMSTQGRHYEAMTHFRNAVNMNPGYDAAHANLGAEVLDHGRLEEAFAQLGESLRLNPAQPVAEANLGAIYKMRGDLVNARRLLEDSIRRKPDYEFAHSDLCAVLTATREITSALAQCRDAIRLNPRMGESWYHFAHALRAAGYDTEAINAFVMLLRIEPNYRGAREELQMLERTESARSAAVQ